MNNLNVARLATRPAVRASSGPLPAPSQPALWLGSPESEEGVRSWANCPICGTFLSGTYYRVNGETACAICAIQARARQTKRFVLLRCVLVAPFAAIGCLALPFLGQTSWPQDIVGFFALFVCARIAWQLGEGRRLTLDGPYSAN